MARTKLTTIEAHLEVGETLQVEKTKVNNSSDRPFMQCIGRKAMYPQNTRREYDVNGLMRHLSSDVNASWLFWVLLELNNYKYNVAVITRNKLTPAEIVKLTRGYKVLSKYNVVKRIRHNTYLLNPVVVVPGNKYLDRINSHWDNPENLNYLSNFEDYYADKPLSIFEGIKK